MHVGAERARQRLDFNFVMVIVMVVVVVVVVVLAAVTLCICVCVCYITYHTSSARSDNRAHSNQSAFDASAVHRLDN